MSNHTYGVSVNGSYVDISKTEKGAKRYATFHGYTEVYIRFNNGYHVALVAEKKGKYWINVA